MTTRETIGEDLAHAATLPASWYHDPAIYEAERERVFAREWLLFAHESMLASPGDYVAQTIAGWPVFVLRGRDGGLRGFHNVCRHRAGPLVWDGRGRCDVLRCRYHGWVYDGEGRLRHAPDFGAAKDFALGDFALFPVRTSSWRGLVFICLAETAPPLEDSLAGFAALAAAVPLEAFQLESTASHAFACNWKTYIENYLEGYHIPVMHPLLNREIAMAKYRVEVGQLCVSHVVPLREEARGSAIYSGLWAWLAPNAAINVYDTGASIECAWPLGPTTMRLDYLYLFTALNAAGAEQRAATRAMSRQVTAEDQAICEAVQRNLAAGVYDRGRLSPRHEGGVHYFQSLMRRALS